MGGDHVGVADGAKIDILMGLNAGHGLDAVAVLGRQFELQRVRRRLHALGQVGLHGPGSAGQEIPRLTDKIGVVVLGNAPDAGRRTTLDLIQQAGPGASGKDVVRARAQQERPLQHVERVIDRPNGSERPEVVARPRFRPPVFHHLGIVVVAGDQDVGEGFVVAQKDVVARRVALDQVGFKQQGLRLGRRGHELHVRGQRDHAADAGRLAFRRRIGRDPLFQILRLADVEHGAVDGDHAIDPGRIGQGLQMAGDDLRPPGDRSRRHVRVCRSVVVILFAHRHRGSSFEPPFRQET